ncbi:MAG: ribonuclease D [Gemmatimonadetes bacterium]|nr:ribonuclease D [Gemmatimonadota bacterium]MBT6147157.1 ribonuclease D [Gemmatimonadota bacterium]MBT7864621.1 ribonuclease D [Gemmatimonadota bacterium]
MIVEAEALEEQVEAAQAAGRVAIDTEMVWERTFYPDLGVVQIGLDRERCFLVDTVALEGDMASLGQLIQDEKTQKILHDATQDLSILKRATGAAPRNIFDTRLAAGFSGLASTISLRDLLIELLDIELDKTETRTDWLQRPLADNQIGYAEDDVRYLVDACQLLQDRAEAAGHLSWLREEMASLDAPEIYQERDPRQEYRRVKGYGKLRGRELAVLRELTMWREDAAREHNRPRGRIASDKLLLFLAQRQPRLTDELSEVRSFRRREIDLYGEAILAAVDVGQALAEADWPTGPPRDRHDRAFEESVKEAMGHLREHGEATGIDPALISTRAEVKDLLRNGAGEESEIENNRLATGWRWQLIGEDLLSRFGKD